MAPVEKQLELIRRAIALRPGNAEAHNELGAALKELGRFDEAIAAHWPQGVRAAGAPGGFYLWATTPREIRARALLDVAERLGASFLFGEAFFADSGGDHHFRLALTAVARNQIGEGIRRIGQAMATLRA